MSRERKREPQQSVVADVKTRLAAVREKIPPEREYLLGAIVTYVYLAVLIAPDRLPAPVQPVAESLKQSPEFSRAMLLYVLLGSLATVDGARRIVEEKLLFYRAFINVYLRSKVQAE